MEILIDYLDSFYLYLLSEKGVSLKTLEAYQHDLSLFFAFHKENKITEETLIHYFSFLHQKGYQASSIARFSFALKAFVRYLIREKRIDEKILLYFEHPKIAEKLPTILTVDEITRIIAAPPIDTLLGKRDRAILELLYGSGIRVSELVDLNIHDLDASSLKVKGKGDKERLLPLHEKAHKAIDDYLSLRHDPHQALFITSSLKRVDRQTIWRCIKKYAQQAGIQKNISPHTFRHSYATHLLDGGADLRIIQELLGHVFITTTERYTQVSRSKVQKAFYTFHPKP